jgi:hypothetical protein
MSTQESIESDKKYIVSMRLNNNDRMAIRAMASRLFVRESELYRCAVNNLLNCMEKLHDMDCAGSDLLPLFIGFRVELIQGLGLKKQQLFNIINSGNIPPDKFVGMADIELLMMPPHLLRQRLSQIDEAVAVKQEDVGVWLERYFAEKYGLDGTDKEEFQPEEPESYFAL